MTNSVDPDQTALSFILFELFPLELCPSQKQLSMTIFIPGYDCAIVNYIDRYLY